MTKTSYAPAMPLYSTIDLCTPADHIAVIRGYALEERSTSFGCALRRGWLIRTSDNLAR